MTLVEQINEDIKTAMKAKDKDSLNAIRAIKSAILIEATKEANAEVEDVTILKILQKLLKQRKDSATLYHEQNRTDLAKEEEVQAEIIAKYLPQLLSENEVIKAVEAVIKQVGAQGPKDMGKVMGVLGKELAGKADNALVAQTVKRLLNS